MLRGKRDIQGFPKILEHSLGAAQSLWENNRQKAHLMSVSPPTKLKLWSCPFGRTINPGQSAKVQCLQAPKRLLIGQGVGWIYLPNSILAAGIIVVLCAQSLTSVWLFVTPWTATHWDPLSMGFSRQEYWSQEPFPFPGDLPNPGIEPTSPVLAGVFFITELPGKPLWLLGYLIRYEDLHL